MCYGGHRFPYTKIVLGFGFHHVPDQAEAIPDPFPVHVGAGLDRNGLAFRVVLSTAWGSLEPLPFIHSNSQLETD